MSSLQKSGVIFHFHDDGRKGSLLESMGASFSRYCEPCWESWHRRGEIPREDEDEAGAKEENLVFSLNIRLIDILYV